MNINKDSVKVLCYGDSNTWGYIPGTGYRFPVDVRWTGLLQKTLGDSYEIVEEGLNSRTTNLNDPKSEGKNGKAYLLPCLQTHAQIDIVILMLGTNDMKERFARDPQQIAEGVEELVKMIRNLDLYVQEKQPRLILVSPILVDETVDGVKEKYLGAEEKSKQLGDLYKEVAERNNCEFINLVEHVQPSKVDGYHLAPESHKKIAELFHKVLTEK